MGLKRADLPSVGVTGFQVLLFLYAISSNSPFPCAEIYELLANILGLTQSQENLEMRRDKRNHWQNRVQYAKRKLVREGLVTTPRNGQWLITAKGIQAIKVMKEPI
ncbi:winged helix-turn-helix domain-containing protein [Clostridium magnum]|uniref:Restriction system protein Mrr-like N-terminal domain-containing protein n=1 Tax=Clostridium magnum DSM 2767 TaxID=1121326 RepID=A0A162QYR8_9CLOT|nr:winged helix-turn-helix domain-containing protein [Clostridium magnum]KZL89165.1 hypothetical protein CLMAG_53830 [Clostridium magnum DSM 2767]SHJ25104.1 Mrr N-terminal domain-containing protein [Clostridium magnum DSM 2767]